MCPTTDEWINKMWSIHTTEYYSALERREILTPATTQMSLVDVTLNEVSQSQKDKFSVIPLVQDP